jgi:hypothetical protein
MLQVDSICSYGLPWDIYTNYVRNLTNHPHMWKVQIGGHFGETTA